MFNKMNQQKAVTNTQEVSKGREVFGNWELSDELDDADLMAVAGGGEGEGFIFVGDTVIGGGFSGPGTTLQVLNNEVIEFDV
jgi:hypothetical protein